MQILPITTPLLKNGSDLAEIILKQSDIQPNDIIVVSSKAVATVEGAMIKLNNENFDEAVLQEVSRMNGKVISNTNGILLTELKPHGMEGTLLVPNAGLDRSNIEGGFAVGWPHDPAQSAKQLRERIEEKIDARVAVIISDSGLQPRRMGVIAFALALSGLDPFNDVIGTPDLFGKKLQVTVEATADQLATAANAVMGNASESTPAAIIRDHGLSLSDYTGWVPAIERERDLYHGII